jgi:DNA helicase-2/ATP-dependent DNA helicase PcrA
VNEGVIPLHNSFAKETDIEEERRLFYVGITRAKDELVCTMSRKRTIMGSATISSQSCFVKEMDEKKLLKEKFGLEQNVKQMSFL